MKTGRNRLFGADRPPMSSRSFKVALAVVAAAACTEVVAADAPQAIKLSPSERGATISPGIFGHLIEPYGRTVDGIWVGEDSPIPNVEGYRRDTLEALQKIRAPLFRWPGGTFADGYHWRDGIGPRAERPRRRNTFFGGIETNQFGTDEFLRFCELLGAEACIKVNPVTGTLQETLDWMEYCNFAGDSDLANLRRKNGHAEPYGVKYWQLGNETLDAFTPERYAELVHMWTFYMRQTDPDSKIIVSGSPGRWNDNFLPAYAEMLRHGGIATSNMIHLLGMKYVGENDIGETTSLLDKYLGNGAVDILVEEWAHNHLPQPTDKLPNWHWSFPVELEVLELLNSGGYYEQTCTLRDALRAAERLQRDFMKHADRVKMTSILYVTNTWQALIKTDGPRFLVTPTYHLFDMLKGFMNAELVKVEYKGPLNVIAAASKDGKQTVVSIVNGEQGAPTAVSLSFTDAGSAPHNASALVLTGGLDDENSFEAPDRIKPRSAAVEAKDRNWIVECPVHSVTVVTFE